MAKKKKKVKSSSKVLWIIIALALVVVAGMFLAHRPSMAPTTPQIQLTAFNFGNQKIMLDNEALNFVNGVYESTDETYGQHMAQVANRSVNQAGNRAAAILIDSPGGSGTFYYLIGAMQKDGKELYSEPIPLGDRIKMVSVSVDNPEEENNGVVTIEYLDRPKNAPMSTDPTVAVIKHYAFEDNGNLIEVLH